MARVKAKDSPLAAMARLTDLNRRISNMEYLVGFHLRERAAIVATMREALGRHLVSYKFIDFDARRDPKTSHYCVACQRDLDPTKPSSSLRLVHVDGAAPHAVAVADVPLLDAGILEIGPRDHDYGRIAIGNDCARKLGPGWTVKKPDKAPNAKQP